MTPDEQRDFERRLRDTERLAQANAAAQSTHEQVCAQRYEAIREKQDDAKKSMDKLTWIVIAALVTVSGGTAAVETASRVVSQMSGGG